MVFIIFKYLILLGGGNCCSNPLSANSCSPASSYTAACFKGLEGRDEIWCCQGLHSCSPVPLGSTALSIQPVSTLNTWPVNNYLSQVLLKLENAQLSSHQLITCLPQLHKRWDSTLFLVWTIEVLFIYLFLIFPKDLFIYFRILFIYLT